MGIYHFIYTVSRPILDEMRHWLDTTHPTAKTKTGVAMRYCRDEWKYLERYMLDGRLEISNNRAERSIKPFVIDRKNFLFANTSRGARSAAVIFSIVQTARENGLNVYEYLSYLFARFPNMDPQNLDAIDTLLPWMPGPQRVCKTTAGNQRVSDSAV